MTIFNSINAGSSSHNYEYMVEALNNVIKVAGVDLKGMYEDRINEDMKKLNPQEKELKEQLEANKEAQYAIRKKKIAMLAEQYKNDPIRLSLLSKVARDLAILEKECEGKECKCTGKEDCECPECKKKREAAKKEEENKSEE